MKTSNMTLTAYECRVTEIIDELRGDGFQWPESCESDIHACFLKHMQPEEAAADLLSIWESSYAYWLDGSAYCRGCVECSTPAIDAADATFGPAGGANCRCCGGRADDGEPEYRIAFVRENGDWDVVETFHVANHDAAREYAESQYGENDVFVLDHNGRNIDGGVDG